MSSAAETAPEPSEAAMLSNEGIIRNIRLLTTCSEELTKKYHEAAARGIIVPEELRRRTLSLNSECERCRNTFTALSAAIDGFDELIKETCKSLMRIELEIGDLLK